MSLSKFHKSQWEVRPVTLQVARDLVERFHYAQGGPNTGVQFDGLFYIQDIETCKGVAWWLPPTKPAAISVCGTSDDWRRVISLCRLVIIPEVPKNAASFLLSKAIKRLRSTGRWDIAVTYADTRMNHSGLTYKASGWTYLGETKGDVAWLDSNGRQISKKATKSRTVAEMKALGLTKSGPWPKHKFVRRIR